MWNQVVDETTRECRRVICKPVEEWVEREVSCTVLKPVVTKKMVCEDQGQWVIRKVCKPGLPLPSLQWDCCLLPRLCLQPGPGIMWLKKEWCPNPITREVECVTYVPEVEKKMVKERICRIERQEIVEQIPVKTCRWVCKDETYTVPVRSCEWVCETVTKSIPHRTCKMVTEELTRTVPVRTCKVVTETKTRQVPYCVSKQVEHTVKQRVARCVPKTVEVKTCRMVCKQVPRVVEYEVCRIVPTTVCVGGCVTGTPAKAAQEQEAFKPTPAVEPVPEAKKEEAVPSTTPAAPQVKPDGQSA